MTKAVTEKIVFELLIAILLKKFVIIDRKLFRPTQTTALKANINKARKIIKFKPKIDINKLISIMMENDLNAEKRN